MTDVDVDDFHAVLYTADWTLVDAAGQRHPWAQVREQELQSLKTALPDAMSQRIRKKKGDSHSPTEVTVFHDSSVKASDTWKLKSREQVGEPKVLVDKPAY